MEKIKVVTPDSKQFPQNLLAIDTVPEKLYYQGTLLQKDQIAIAVVGSRKMTNYGRAQAWKFASELAKSGVTIISGLARGIDTTAHKAALDAKGRTLAVLGSGLNHLYPPENKQLAEQITKTGAVISEFDPNSPPQKKNFLIRNRLIAGLSKAVLIVEGARRSGTLSTASWAANYNKEVFAIPGPIDSPTSEAPNWLIKQGASIARTPKDLLAFVR